MPQADLVTNSHSTDREYSTIKLEEEAKDSNKPNPTAVKPPQQKPPILRQKPKLPLAAAVLGVVIVGILLLAWSVLPGIMSGLNPSQADEQVTPASVQNQAPSAMTKALDSSRQFLAILFLILIFIASFVFLSKAFRKSVESLGRNPLASRDIKQTLIAGLMVVILVMGISFVIAYLIFYGNPPPDYSRVNPTPPPPLSEVASSTVYTTNCLTVALPFTSSYPKLHLRENSCTLIFTLVDPPGSFTLTYKTKPDFPLDEDPNVTMRRLYTTTYTETTTTHPKFPQILTFSTDTEITLYLRNQEQQQFELSFHDLQPGFDQVISSATIYHILDSLLLPDVPHIETLTVVESDAEAGTNPSPTLP